jgi:hypothetical protein
MGQAAVLKTLQPKRYLALRKMTSVYIGMKGCAIFTAHLVMLLAIKCKKLCNANETINAYKILVRKRFLKGLFFRHPLGVPKDVCTP